MARGSSGNRIALLGTLCLGGVALGVVLVIGIEWRYGLGSFAPRAAEEPPAELPARPVHVAVRLHPVIAESEGPVAPSVAERPSPAVRAYPRRGSGGAAPPGREVVPNDTGLHDYEPPSEDRLEAAGARDGGDEQQDPRLGRIGGTVLFDGPAPAAPVPDRSRDRSCRSAPAPTSDVSGGRIANVLVRLLNAPPVTGPPRTVRLRQLDCGYDPSVVALARGDNLVIETQADLAASMVTMESGRREFAAMAKRTRAFRKNLAIAGVRTVTDVLNPSVRATVHVLDSRHFAVTTRDGRFVIPNVLPGRYVLEASHASAHPTQAEVSVAPGENVELSVHFGARAP